jgi:oxygen-dependent protoporphyrinogen oxidase
MRIVVVGGGVSGLSAAYELAGRGIDVVVVEQADRLGGKLRTTTLADGMIESGAEAFLVGDPIVVELAAAVGLGGAIRHPTAAKAAIATGGSLREMPVGTLLGIPADPVQGVRDEPADGPLLAPGADVSVGDLVRPRRGDEVVDTYVEPLLGGVYAGRADALSLRMAVPALAAAAESATTLTEAVRAALGARKAVPAGGQGRPVFGTVEGGVSRLVSAVAGRLPAVRLGSPVRAMQKHGTGWRLTLGPTRAEHSLDADGVVLAVPAAPAARLLSTVDGVRPVPLDYAGVVLVALAFAEVDLPELSGFLVPPKEGFAVKAATFFDVKWAHQRRADGVRVLRASLGRHGETAVLQHPDADLVDLVRAELAKLVGTLPPHLEAKVFRWGGALPQYTSGHRTRVERLRDGLLGTGPLAVAGAAYDGVGIPACVRSGRTAAQALLGRLSGPAPALERHSDRLEG